MRYTTRHDQLELFLWLETLWLRGGYPPAFLEADGRARWEWLDAYSRAFIERDLPALGIDVSASQMRRLWAMLAHANGGLWNASRSPHRSG